MKLTSALKVLHQFDSKGRYVYLRRDLRKLFDDKTERGFTDSLQRLVRAGLLERAARSVYVFSYSRHKHSSSTFERVAIDLRRGSYNYVTAESALHEYALISQIPQRLKIMTTGRSGLIKTNFGVIEFTHTNRTPLSIYESTMNVGRPLRLATEEAALRDLKRIGRNSHLIEESISVSSTYSP